MDFLPLNSASLNTLLRSAGLRSDYQAQQSIENKNFSAVYSDKLSQVTTDNYNPGTTNYKQPEASYFSLIQPQFQSNSPISKGNNIKNSHFENSTTISRHSKINDTKLTGKNLITAQIYSSQTEMIGTGYFVTAPSDNPNVLDLVPERKQMDSKFKIYFDQTKIKGTLVNVMF